MKIFNYKAPNGVLSRCGVQVYDKAVVVLTELNDNPGMSVTNAIEELAYTVCFEYGLDPAEVIWLTRSEGSRNFDRVKMSYETSFPGDTLVLFKNPVWEYLEHEEGELIIGRPYREDFFNE